MQASHYKIYTQIYAEWLSLLLKSVVLQGGLVI